MAKFQTLVGFPVLGGTIFKVAIRYKKTGEEGWNEYVPAENEKEALKKAEDALKELAKEKDFYGKYQPVVMFSFLPCFDGGEGLEKWRNCGFKGEEPDQYVSACDKGGINMYIFKIGKYPACRGCENINACCREAFTAGEQAEL